MTIFYVEFFKFIQCIMLSNNQTTLQCNKLLFYMPNVSDNTLTFHFECCNTQHKDLSLCTLWIIGYRQLEGIIPVLNSRIIKEKNVQNYLKYLRKQRWNMHNHNGQVMNKTQKILIALCKMHDFVSILGFLRFWFDT